MLSIRRNLQYFRRLLALATTACIFSTPLSSSVAAAYDNKSTAVPTESRRIEVYSLSQNYWDTRYGETLSEIVLHLLPNNPSKHAALEQDIVHLNPHAFINGDPSQLLADKRLQLPGYMKQADTRVDPIDTTVESYSWGNIKRRIE